MKTGRREQNPGK